MHLVLSVRVPQEGRFTLDRRDPNPLTDAEFPVPALANSRLPRIEFVLGVIVLLLLVGEAWVIDVLKRRLGG